MVALSYFGLVLIGCTEMQGDAWAGTSPPQRPLRDTFIKAENPGESEKKAESAIVTTYEAAKFSFPN